MIPLTPDDDAREQDPMEEMPFHPSARAAVPVTLAAPPDRVDPLNLARRPFLNSRPVVRASLLLWLLGLLLLLGNVSLFWNYRQRSADKRAQITRGEAEIANQQAASAKLRHQLDSFNLDEQNQRVDFLNQQIAERTFSWSALLDLIADRLPHDVRLNRLAPLTGEKAAKEAQHSRNGSSSRRTPRGSDQVSIAITGETREYDQLLSFVQSLFSAPFSEPDLIRDEKQEDGKTFKFEITVLYRPGAAPLVAGAAGGATGAASSTDAKSTAMKSETSKTAGKAAGKNPTPRIEELPMPGAPSPLTPQAPTLHPPLHAEPTTAAPTLHPPLHAEPAPPPGGRS